MERWTLTVDYKLPFTLSIRRGDGSIVVEAYATAFSSEQKSREDNLAGVGFRWSDRADAVALVAKQERDFRLMTAAPKLLALLAGLVEQLDTGGSEPLPEDHYLLVSARSLIQKLSS
jgi:hypothetical protein